MVIGILQVELLIHGAESLKDKRRVVRSVKDRLHREHQCSVAEVANQDLLNSAVLGVAVVAPDGQRAGETLDRISVKLRNLGEAEVAATRRHVIHGSALPEPEDAIDEAALADEMLRRFDEPDDRGRAT